MALAHVQSMAYIVPDGNYYTNFSIYLSGDVGNVTVNNYIFMWVLNADAGTSVSDSLGNTYVEQTFDSWQGRMFVAKVTTGGDCTVYADFTSTNTYPYGYAMEFSGNGRAQPAVLFNSDDGTSMTSGGVAGDAPVSSQYVGTLIVSMFYDDGTYGPGYWTDQTAGSGCANLRNVNAGWPNVCWITSAQASAFSNFTPTITGVSGADREYTQWDIVFAPYELQQEGFRFRNDDGSETTASWKANQDTQVPSSSGTPFRIRFVINATGDTPSTAYQLEYKRSTSSNWKKVM